MYRAILRPTSFVSLKWDCEHLDNGLLYSICHAIIGVNLMRKIINIIRSFRLAWRLLWDSRVPMFLKMFLAIPLAYGAFPLDLARDFRPFGAIDDLIILAISLVLFIALSPLKIVEEHREALWGTRVDEQEGITDAEYQVLDDEESEDPPRQQNGDAESSI